MDHYPLNLRRLRLTPSMRNLLSTVELSPRHLIQPYFVYEAEEKVSDLPSLYRQKKHTIDSLKKTIEEGLKSGISSVLLFIIPKEKQVADFHYNFDGKVIESIKSTFGSSLNLFTDICLCSNTTSGHCGILNHDGFVDNDQTVKELVKKSLIHAHAGCDVLSPSDMMDDRILAIRRELDATGLQHKMIMSYSTKFCSHFYGPFREAAESAPSKGDRKSYQIDYRNVNDAMLSSYRDIDQGADMIMVKPAGAYLDILYRLKQDEKTKHTPLCAYQVSGEYQSLYVTSTSGLLNFQGAFLESLYAIKRSGADMIISYGANDFSSIL